MAITRVSRSFKDISLSFEPHPVTKDLPVLKNERAIIRSVRNIVETIPTEKFFNSTFGLSKSEPSIKNELLPVGKTDGNSLILKNLDVDKSPKTPVSS